MPYDLIGFASVTIGVEDVGAAARQFAALGFSVRPLEGTEAEIALGNARLLLSQAAPAGFGRVGLSSRNLAASREALGAKIDAPGLEVDLIDATTASPALLHANGAVALASLTAVVENPEATMPAYDRLFGAFAATPTDDMVTVHGCGPMLFLVNEDGFDHLHSNLKSRIPAAPALAALALAVADLDGAETYLREAGIGISRHGPSLSIAPSACFGLGLELVAA